MSESHANSFVMAERKADYENPDCVKEAFAAIRIRSET